MLIPAIEKVKVIKTNKQPVVKIFPSDIYKVFNMFLSPYDVFIILKSLVTLMILNAVGLKSML